MRKFGQKKSETWKKSVELIWAYKISIKQIAFVIFNPFYMPTFDVDINGIEELRVLCFVCVISVCLYMCTLKIIKEWEIQANWFGHPPREWMKWGWGKGTLHKRWNIT